MMPCSLLVGHACTWAVPPLLPRTFKTVGSGEQLEEKKQTACLQVVVGLRVPIDYKKKENKRSKNDQKRY